MRITHLIGARPNFVKVAPVIRALEARGGVEQLLIHTGQHYDDALSRDFLHDLELPEPDLNLGVGSGSHAVQTAAVMTALEPVLQRIKPDWLFTVGDVNSTLAGALTAVKLGVRVAHVEAGLRSHDWTMPEEINRLLTDRISDALFTTEPSANYNLAREGIDSGRVFYVGNVMIDALDRYRPKTSGLKVEAKLGVTPGEFALVTLHRPSNVDDPDRLRGLLAALGRLSEYCPVVFPIHPRTANKIEEYGLGFALTMLNVTGPLRYLEFLALMDRAGVVISDSGGIQEETTVLGVPCITVRPNTERPVTVTEGTNRLFDGDPADLTLMAVGALNAERKPHRPELWDGRAAERIADLTLKRLRFWSRGRSAGSEARI